MNNYTGATYKAEAKSYGAYPTENNSQRGQTNSDIDPTWTAYPGIELFDKEIAGFILLYIQYTVI